LTFWLLTVIIFRTW